mgnify:CR=1 FL=1
MGAGPAGCKALANCLKKNVALTDLRLCDNLIGVKGADALAYDLACSSLAELKLFARCSGMLKVNKALRRLHIAANDIQPPGIKAHASELVFLAHEPRDWQALAQGLKNNTTLTELNVSWNRFGPEGAKHLGMLLKTNHSLKELYLSHNKIIDDGEH